MRNYFDEQLRALHEEMTALGQLCEAAIAAAMDCLDADGKNAVGVRELERQTDEKEREVESLCMKLLLRQQPVVRDLRTISSALKMVSDLERIGDQAADIAEIAEVMPPRQLRDATHLRVMAEAARNMVTGSVAAFVTSDLVLARRIMAEDDTVDALFCTVRSELIAQIGASPENGEECVDLLMIAKYLERIADHAVNVAEWVEYALIGTHKA